MNWVGSHSLVIVCIYLALVILTVIYGIYQIVRNMTVQNSMIIQEDHNLLILYQFNELNADAAGKVVTGSVLASGDLHVNQVKNIDPNVKKILDDPTSLYDFYTDCEFLKEEKSCYLFHGRKVDYAGHITEKDFKIQKIYSNLNELALL